MNNLAVAAARFLAKTGIFLDQQHPLMVRGEFFRNGQAYYTGADDSDVEGIDVAH
jgi:hypothetical protein